MKNLFASMVAIAALCLSAFTAIADEPELVEVIAVGAGMTQDEAHKAADKAAVQQVVGTIVDITTLVENDEVVEDKVLTYSAALIADSKIIGTPKKDSNGLITLKVKATVKKTALKEKLTAAKLVSVAIDGESLWAQAVSAQDNLADAEAMIEDVLAKHIACVVAEPIPGKTGKSPLDYDPKTGEVFANVRVKIDQAKYTKFAEEVVGKLETMAIGKSKVISKDRMWGNSDYKQDGGVSFDVPATFLDRDKQPENCLLVMTSFRTGNGVFLRFDKNVAKAINLAVNAGPIALEVKLSSASGEELAVKHKPLVYDGNMTLLETFEDHSGAILPLFDLDLEFHTKVQSGSYTRAHYAREKLIKDGATQEEDFNKGLVMAKYHIPLGSFTPDELKTAAKLDIKVGHMKDGLFVE